MGTWGYGDDSVFELGAEVARNLEKHPLPETDRLRLALANPGLLFGLTRPGMDWVRSTFLTAPVFRFDEKTSAKAGYLSMSGLGSLGKIMPDIRLPTKSCVIALNFKATMTAVFDCYPEQLRRHKKIEADAATSLVLLCHTSNPELPIIDIYLAWYVDDIRVGLCPMCFRFDAHGERAVDHPMFHPVADWLVKKTMTCDKNHVVRRMIEEAGCLGNVEIQNDLDDATWSRRLARVLYVISSGLMLDRKVILEDPAVRYAFQSLLSKVSLRLTRGCEPYYVERSAGPMAEETRGTPRMVVAILGLLSMREHELIQMDAPSRKPGRIRHGNRSAPYFSESVVRLAVPDKRFIYLMKKKAEERARHRRHNVIGTWVHKGGQPDSLCDHAWQEIDVHHSECPKCTRKKWWRKEHERGDASLGWVRHRQYNVVTGKEA